MSPELDNKLVSKYPKIFANRYGDMQTTAMCWGFECGDGWYALLDTACNLIQQHIDWRNKVAKTPEDMVDQVVAEQVKEKFGGLRFYVNGGDQYTGGVIDACESMSTKTCEQCGSPGKVRGSSWFYTSCDEHSKE